MWKLINFNPLPLTPEFGTKILIHKGTVKGWETGIGHTVPNENVTSVCPNMTTGKKQLPNTV